MQRLNFDNSHTTLPCATYLYSLEITPQHPADRQPHPAPVRFGLPAMSVASRPQPIFCLMTDEPLQSAGNLSLFFAEAQHGKRVQSRQQAGPPERELEFQPISGRFAIAIFVCLKQALLEAVTRRKHLRALPEVGVSRKSA